MFHTQSCTVDIIIKVILQVTFQLPSFTYRGESLGTRISLTAYIIIMLSTAFKNQRTCMQDSVAIIIAQLLQPLPPKMALSYMQEVGLVPNTRHAVPDEPYMDVGFHSTDCRSPCQQADATPQ